MMKILKILISIVFALFVAPLNSCGNIRCEFCGEANPTYEVCGRKICESCYNSNRSCHICGKFGPDLSINSRVGFIYISQRDGVVKTVCFDCCEKLDICPGCYRIYSEADYYYNGRKLCYDCYRMFSPKTAYEDCKSDYSAFHEFIKMNGLRLKLCLSPQQHQHRHMRLQQRQRQNISQNAKPPAIIVIDKSQGVFSYL